jgi:hypothetical protein
MRFSKLLIALVCVLFIVPVSANIVPKTERVTVPSYNTTKTFHNVAGKLDSVTVTDTTVDTLVLNKSFNDTLILVKTDTVVKVGTKAAALKVAKPVVPKKTK